MRIDIKFHIYKLFFKSVTVFRTFCQEFWMFQCFCLFLCNSPRCTIITKSIVNSQKLLTKSSTIMTLLEKNRNMWNLCQFSYPHLKIIYIKCDSTIFHKKCNIKLESRHWNMYKRQPFDKKKCFVFKNILHVMWWVFNNVLYQFLIKIHNNCKIFRFQKNMKLIVRKCINKW